MQVHIQPVWDRGRSTGVVDASMCPCIVGSVRFISSVSCPHGALSWLLTCHAFSERLRNKPCSHPPAPPWVVFPHAPQVQANVTDLARLTNFDTLKSLENTTARLANLTSSSNLTLVASLATSVDRMAASVDSLNTTTAASISTLTARINNVNASSTAAATQLDADLKATRANLTTSFNNLAKIVSLTNSTEIDALTTRINNLTRLVGNMTNIATLDDVAKVNATLTTAVAGLDGKVKLLNIDEQGNIAPGGTARFSQVREHVARRWWS